MTGNVKLLLFLALLFATPIFSQVTTVTIQPSASAGKDAMVIDVNPSVNYGGLNFMRVMNSVDYLNRGYIEIDVTSIPLNAIIIEAKLKLFGYAVWSPTTMEVSRVIEPWQENAITWANVPNVTNVDIKTQTFGSSNNVFHEIDVRSHVQEFVNYPHLNFGWRLRPQNETSNGNGSVYWTSDYSSSAKRPKLEISYVLPIEITANQIIHADTPSSSNGSISVNATEGDGTYTYQWINGATGNDIPGETSSTINNLSPGWYGVKVTDGLGNISYMAFVVGAKCGEVEIEFNPGPDFMDDAYVYNLIKNGINNGVTYNGGLSQTLHSENGTNSNWYLAKSIMKFNLQIDPNLQVNSANFYLYSTGAHWNLTGTNESKMNRVIASWQESLVTYNTVPSSTITDQVLLPATTSASQNEVLDLIDFVNYWQQNPQENFGFTFELQNPTPNKYRRRIYYSSDYSISAMRPKLVLHLGGPCMYAKPKKQLDGVKYRSNGDNFYFFYSEEYFDENATLNYKVYSSNRSIVLDTQNQNLINLYGDNRLSLDVSSLSIGAYVLEIENDKGEMFYLRFVKS